MTAISCVLRTRARFKSATGYFVFVLSVLALVTGEANAQNRGAPEHTGFYLRLQGGLGGTSASDGNVTLSGGSGAMNVEIGGALFEDFILFGKVWGASTPNPAVTVYGVTFLNAGTATGGFGALGVGINYYLMPANFYFSGAISGTSLILKDSGSQVGTATTGIGLHLGLGKEWWVSANWGLGIGGELALTRAYNWSAGALILYFSATYN
jgi:hypothetical protein